MSLVSIKDAYLSFNDLKIFKQTVLHIHANERICLIGNNGAGKSTLLKVINKTQDLDHGHVIYKKDIKIAFLKQEHPKNVNMSVYDFIVSGLLEKNANKKKIDVKTIADVNAIIEKLKLKKNDFLFHLSGGLLRKASIGHVLIGKPDVLLLDEPTNHLDINTIAWLETTLKKFSGSILFTSHDRSFIQNVCTRIIDLDRGKLISWPGDYQNFIKLKHKSCRIEKITKKLFDKKLKQEEQWLRKSTKARTTRNEGRVKNLKTLKQKFLDYKEKKELTHININYIENYRKKIIFKLQNIFFYIKNKIIINNFSSIVQHGDKIGLIGDNGCGKSTLLKIITQKIQPTTGEIHSKLELKIAYFDQNRSMLDPNKSIIDNISYGHGKIFLHGKEIHLVSYLKSFLFEPYQLTSLVKTLSGGECNRLLLAQLFLTPSNVLILDEPTNDLDLNTMQLLETAIISYQGTVLIVSHDKEFIKKTVHKYWLFQKDGTIIDYIGQYNFFKIPTTKKNIYKTTLKLKNNQNNLNILKLQKKNKCFKHKLKKIINEIEQLEYDITQLQEKTNTLNFFKQDQKKILLTLNNLRQKEKNLKVALETWENLEKKNSI
ncbi:MAG: ATP-binding cassette domain-containing protein [Buchnera aphidicola (Pentalonia nigronervosa)]|uniref:ATP-binding cassette domain-containing protein n=1 Tax=Buchnera aphidicola (Pentalonia nigronervosa) TaxID=1309793 RepID=A0A7H1AZY3_9GAMM|nr:MAG: ATP-binding cassette domain-containing protein [Buchnera aphidicola (Pentalonia nigronervosa)]